MLKKTFSKNILIIGLFIFYSLSIIHLPMNSNLTNETYHSNSMKLSNKLVKYQIKNFNKEVISQAQVNGTVKPSEKGKIEWNKTVPLTQYGSVALLVNFQGSIKENPEYGIKPGSTVKITTNVDSSSANIVLKVHVPNVINLNNSLDLGKALGPHSVPVPVPDLNVVTVTASIDIGLKEELTFIYPNSTLISKELTMNQSNLQTETIKISNGLSKGDIVLLKTYFILFISDITIKISSFSFSKSLKSSELNYEWTSNNYFQIGIGIGKSKPLPGFESIPELLIFTVLSLKILYKRKMNK